MDNLEGKRFYQSTETARAFWLVLLAWITYILLVFISFPAIGLRAGVFVTLPVVVAAYLLGTNFGVITAVTSVLINLLLFNYVLGDNLQTAFEHFFWTAVMALIGYAIGKFGETRKRMGKQIKWNLEVETTLRATQEQLEDEVERRTVELISSNARLRAELARRKETEKALRYREDILRAVAIAGEKTLKSESWIETVGEVIQELGTASGAGRAYIFENSFDAQGNLFCSQRFEWAAEGVEPQIDNPELQNVPFVAAGFGRWASELGNSRPVVGKVADFPPDEQELLKAQDILSLAVVPIFAGEAWWGFMGFDAVEKVRNWSRVEVDALQAAANIIGEAILREDGYDKTLLGWARALELRDEETQDHTIRVTQMTLRLAEKLGFSGAELTHLERGALLHDIGKVGISDQILRKPGPLTKKEWEEMRKHPQFARDILSPISFLNAAITIPYYHHERWDGSGYPLGLKGEKIPLAARIFAVVDVWDALSSDRPYRKAWPKGKVLAYLQDNTGVLFDPEIVEDFLSLLKEGGDHLELVSEQPQSL